MTKEVKTHKVFEIEKYLRLAHCTMCIMGYSANLKKTVRVGIFFSAMIKAVIREDLCQCN